jgi:hypothetical protein
MCEYGQATFAGARRVGVDRVDAAAGDRCADDCLSGSRTRP